MPNDQVYTGIDIKINHGIFLPINQIIGLGQEGDAVVAHTLSGHVIPINDHCIAALSSFCNVYQAIKNRGSNENDRRTDIQG